MPFAVTSGFYIVIAITMMAALRYQEAQITPNGTTLSKAKDWLWKFILSAEVVILVTGSMITSIYTSNNLHGGYLIAGALVISFFSAVVVERQSFFKENLPNPFVRIYLINLLIFTPLMSFALGKSKSWNVYYNNDIKYIKIIDSTKATIINDTASRKFLGFLGDKIIVSSLDNKSIIVLNQSAFDGIEIDSVRIK